MDKPQLFVIAGPNGAGKSVLSRWLLNNHLEAFDGDKLQKALAEQYPALPWEEIQRMAAHQFESQWQAARAERGDFAYETNFTFPQSIQLPITFRESGYEINMFYIGMHTLTESTRRVALRVQNGGHDVDSGSLELNFNGGIVHVLKHFAFFDRFLFIDNPISGPPKIVLYAELGKIKSKSATLPRWATTHFADILNTR
jgi:predicted ABC-type ATPase